MARNRRLLADEDHWIIDARRITFLQTVLSCGTWLAVVAEALDALEKDHAFLLEGGVFTKDVIDTWIEYKRKKEVDQVALRPHPWEFMLYSDV